MSKAITAPKAELVGTGDREAVSAMLKHIPGEWIPALNWIASGIGPGFERIRGSFFTRLGYYARDGVTLEDIQSGGRALASVEVQASCNYPDDYLRHFSRAVAESKRRRSVRAAAVAERERFAAEQAGFRNFWNSVEGRSLVGRVFDPIPKVTDEQDEEAAG